MSRSAAADLAALPLLLSEADELCSAEVLLLLLASLLSLAASSLACASATAFAAVSDLALVSLALVLASPG